jgi:hypothetical protein
MTWNSDGVVDWDELHSLSETLPQLETSMDVGLWVDTGGQRITGDGADEFADKYCLSAYGYSFKNQYVTIDRDIRKSPLIVARYVDAATASLSSFLNSAGAARSNARVILKCFKAGSHVQGGEATASMELELTGARLILQAITCSSPTGMPAEILGFTYATMMLSTRSQLTSGINGATRSCEFSA